MSNRLAAEHPPLKAPRIPLTALVPGLALTLAIAAVALALREIPALRTVSPLMMAIAIGMLVRNTLGTPAVCKPGITFSMRRLLRLAIILLGLQVTLGQMQLLGVNGLGIVVVTLGVTYLFTVWLGRVLGVDRKLASLIGAGTSICGASAVIAANTVVEGSDEDVAYSVASVTIFGSLSMLLYPVLAGPLGLDDQSFGLWSGASIHEIAQVVAASFQHGQVAGEFGTIAKLTRVALLAPLVLALALLPMAGGAGPNKPRSKVPFPWFVVGFVVLILVNSTGIVPAAAKGWSSLATTILLTIALGAMGLETDFRKLKARGLRPLLLGAGTWLFIAMFSLGLVKLAYQ